MFKNPTSKSNWNSEVLVFVEGGKTENPEKSPRMRVKTKNKLNPHETSTGIETGLQRWDWGERLSTATSLLAARVPIPSLDVLRVKLFNCWRYFDIH